MEKIIKNIPTNFFVTSDGKEFKSEKQAQQHEAEITKVIFINNVLNMTDDQLNDEVKNILNIDIAQEWSTDLNEAFGLVDKFKVFDNEINFLYKDYENRWVIGYQHWENIEESVIADTIPKVICFYVILNQKGYL